MEEFKKDDIIIKSTDLLKIIHINDKNIYKCKMWNGDVYELNESDFRHATDGEKNLFHTKQLEFIRTNIAPFLNFFSMRQLASQVKEETAKASMDRQLNTIEQDCFSKLQDIKKLW